MMMSAVTTFVKKIGWKHFFAGAAAALVAERAARPTLVSLVKGGLIAQQGAQGAVNQAKGEFAKIVAEAKTVEKDLSQSEKDATALVTDLLTEMRSLRAELESMKASKSTHAS